MADTSIAPICPRCKSEKPASEFPKSYQGICRDCASEDRKMRFAAKSPEQQAEELSRRRASNRIACAKYKDRHPGKYQEKLNRRHARDPDRWKRWASENPEKRKKSSQEWAERNRERRVAESRAWRELNKDRVKETNERFRKGNPDYQFYWYQKNKERRRETAAAWRENNRDRWRLYSHNRRAIICDGNVSPTLPSELLKLQKNKCACCRGSLKKYGYHIDHIIPLAKGGKHENANIQLLCPSCNVRKSAKDPIEFMQSKGYLI